MIDKTQFQVIWAITEEIKRAVRDGSSSDVVRLTNSIQDILNGLPIKESEGNDDD